MAADAGKGGGARKYKRNEAKCNNYRNQDRLRINAFRRIVRHLRRFGLWDYHKHQPKADNNQHDARCKWEKLNAALPNSVLKRILDEMHA